MTPAHIALAGFQFFLLFHAFAHLVLVQARAQALPGNIAVAVLAAAVLALHHDAGGHVREAHGRVGLVDVLATRAGGTVGVHTHIGRVDVDLDRVVDLRVDEDAGKAGVAAAGGVERALAHQAVHAGFGTQQAEGVIAIDLQAGTLDAGYVARGFLLDLDAEALAFGIANILAQQHAGPVAGLGTAGAGLDVQEGVVGVCRLVEHAAEFQRFHALGDGGGVGFDGFQAGEVVLVAAHFVQLGAVGQLLGELVQHHDHVIERLLFLAQFLGLLGIVPDRRIFERGVDGSQTFCLGRVVKDTPVVLASARTGRPGLRQWR